MDNLKQSFCAKEMNVSTVMSPQDLSAGIPKTQKNSRAPSCFPKRGMSSLYIYFKEGPRTKISTNMN